MIHCGYKELQIYLMEVTSIILSATWGYSRSCSIFIPTLSVCIQFCNIRDVITSVAHIGFFTSTKTCPNTIRNASHSLFQRKHFSKNLSLQVHNAARDVPAGGPGLHSVPHDSQVRLERPRPGLRLSFQTLQSVARRGPDDLGQLLHGLLYGHGEWKSGLSLIIRFVIQLVSISQK